MTSLLTRAALTTLLTLGLAGVTTHASAQATQPSDTQQPSVDPQSTITAEVKVVPRPRTMSINLEQEPLREAVERWSLLSGQQVVANWKAIEAAGVDTNILITLRLRDMPTLSVLALMLDQASPVARDDDARMMLQPTKWYVRILTRAEANRRPVTRIYMIGELLHEVPDFVGPSFDLTDALNNTNSGGGGTGNARGGQARGLFAEDDDREDPGTGRVAREEAVLTAIRNTIEPNLWKANGGDVASMKIQRDLLIVRAPVYVHQQIGLPLRPKVRNPAALNLDPNGRILAKPIAGIADR